MELKYADNVSSGSVLLQDQLHSRYDKRELTGSLIEKGNDKIKKMKEYFQKIC
jgi:hypothetical protein